MAVKPGYKQTEVGVIPEDWDAIEIGGEIDLLTGHPFQSSGYTESGIRLLRGSNVKRGETDWSNAITQYWPTVSPDIVRYELRQGDLVIAMDGSLVGRSYAQLEAEDLPALLLQRVARIRSTKLDVTYLTALVGSERFVRYVDSVKTVTAIPHISPGDIRKFPIPLPPSRAEQRAVAAALSDVDALLAGLDRLIAKKRNLKQAAMQQLLTGQTRLPGFHRPWQTLRIADVASPASEKNTPGEKLPVLTCSKHYGFVDSLGFFKNQVFSRDLSSYRVIRRDEIGYPANHIEEGSIGLQDLYDIALVSPIYVVFTVTEDVNSYFLHRLLKLDSYRQQFRMATTSSVDRRGSLRWPSFSQITVTLPASKTEQTAIAGVLTDIERELTALESRRDKTRDLKRAMMRELLTGKTRLVPAGPAHA